MVIFQYNLYIFVWTYHGCLTNMVYAMDPNNSVIKRLWCNYSFKMSGIGMTQGHMDCNFNDFAFILFDIDFILFFFEDYSWN